MSQDKRWQSQSTRAIGVDFSGLGEDPLSEMQLFKDATTLDELDQVLRDEVEAEVREILKVTPRLRRIRCHRTPATT